MAVTKETPKPLAKGRVEVLPLSDPEGPHAMLEVVQVETDKGAPVDDAYDILRPVVQGVEFPIVHDEFSTLVEPFLPVDACPLDTVADVHIEVIASLFLLSLFFK